MAIKIPRIRYPTGVGGTVWTLTLPWRTSWLQGRRTLGGQHESAAGIVETYVIARRRPLHAVLRVAESELASLDAFLDWWEANGVAFDIDLGDGTWQAVYLDSPAVGEELTYGQAEGWPSAREVPIVVRRTDGAAFATTFFP